MLTSISTRRNVYQDPCHSSSRARGDFSSRIFQDVSRRGCRPCVSGYRVALLSQKAKLFKQTNKQTDLSASSSVIVDHNRALAPDYLDDQNCRSNVHVESASTIFITFRIFHLDGDGDGDVDGLGMR